TCTRGWAPTPPPPTHESCLPRFCRPGLQDSPGRPACPSSERAGGHGHTSQAGLSGSEDARRRDRGRRWASGETLLTSERYHVLRANPGTECPRPVTGQGLLNQAEAGLPDQAVNQRSAVRGHPFGIGRLDGREGPAMTARIIVEL